MKKTDFLKIILGVLLGAIGLMLYKAFSNPSIPQLAEYCKLEVVEGESTELNVEVEDGCTAQWYNQEKGGDPIKENSTTYKLENLQTSTTLYVEAVSEKNARKVSKKRLKIEVKVKEQIAEIPAPEPTTINDPPKQGPIRKPGDRSEQGNSEENPAPVLVDYDQDGVMSDIDKNDREPGPIENNGVPYIIDLMIKQQSDPNKFTINPKFWDAITNDEVQIKFTCLDCGEAPLFATISRNDTYGNILMGSNMNYNGAPGIVKIINYTLKKYYKLKDNCNNYKTPNGLSCKGY